MSDGFDPAPADKHADDPRAALRNDEAHDMLEQGLEDSFPASDPVSMIQLLTPVATAARPPTT